MGCFCFAYRKQKGVSLKRQASYSGPFLQIDNTFFRAKLYLIDIYKPEINI